MANLIIAALIVMLLFRIMNHLTPSSAESDLVMKLRHFHNDGSFYSRCLVVANLSKIGNTNTFPRNSGHGNNIITTIGTVAEQLH